MTTADTPLALPVLEFDQKRLFHMGYVVPNMQRSLKAWSRIGPKVVVPPTIDPIQKVECCLVLFQGAAPIELVSPVDVEDSPVSNRLKRGGGLDHICLFSDDVRTELQSLVDDGAVVAAPPTYGCVFDREIAFAVTRVGLVVELMSKSRMGRLAADPLSSSFHFWGN